MSDEPLVMTLAEALERVQSERLTLRLETEPYHSLSLRSERTGLGSTYAIRTEQSVADVLFVALSEALGRPVVERDDTAELVEALEQSTEALYAAEMVARATGAPIAHIAACIEAARAALAAVGEET